MLLADWKQIYNLNVTEFWLFVESIYIGRGLPRAVMVKSMDCGIVISEFVLQSRNSFSGKYLWEKYEPPYPPSYGLNGITTVLLGEWLWH